MVTVKEEFLEKSITEEDYKKALSFLHNKDVLRLLLQKAGVKALGTEFFDSELSDNMDELIDLVESKLDDIVGGNITQEEFTTLIIKKMHEIHRRRRLLEGKEDKTCSNKVADLKDVINELDKLSAQVSGKEKDEDGDLDDDSEELETCCECSGGCGRGTGGYGGCHDTRCGGMDSDPDEDDYEENKEDRKFDKLTRKLQKFIYKYGDPDGDVIIVTAHGAQWCSNLLRSVDINKDTNTPEDILGASLFS